MIQLNNRFVSRLLLILISFPHFIPAHGLAQQSLSIDRRSLDTYAIINARVFTLTNNSPLERGTIIVRNGLIESVGAQAPAPADARVIDGAGLNVYPGLIDANTAFGMPPASPRSERLPAQQSPAVVPSNTVAAVVAAAVVPTGLQPELMAADLLQPGSPLIEAARNAGITAALVAPRDGILMGQSAFINLAGNTPEEMIVRSPIALHLGFAPSFRPSTYPASLMGVFAVTRQALVDARQYREVSAAYERNARGTRRPTIDKSLAALERAVMRQMPIVMYAETEREIIRALDLAEEFNLQAVIAGGRESWKVAARLRQMNVPVLLSLNFPKRATTQSPEADPDPLRVLRERAEAPKTASRLVAANVRFAFQSGSMENISNFIANAAKAVENGLSKDEALRALTVRSAEIFGVADRLGTIERGKIANLTITRGDLFNQNARITHVFIDGRPVDLKPAATTTTPLTANTNATGNWAVKVKFDEGEQSATLALQQQGESFSGSLQGDLGTAQIANSSVSGAGEIRFTAPVQLAGLTVEAVFTGTLNNNEMRGTVQIVGRQPATFTAVRSGGGIPQSSTPSSTTPPQDNP